MVKGQAALAIGTLLVVVILLFAMTSAWYTNVSRTSTLTFHAESWGFDPSNITVGAAAITSAPGTSGVVPITVDNSGSEDAVKIYVTVSKASMGALANRVYFYADTSAVSGGETVSRVYVGSLAENAYGYDILPGGTLTLGDDYCSDVPIKWKWVYDLEGYYFRGTVHGNTATVDEYIRPVEYDLDSATFERTNGVMTGAPVTIGGDTLAEFLADISAVDGYTGTVRTANAVTVGGSRYYPVEVDAETGVGVWIYLCSYAEIEQAISYDSSIAANAEFTANITISAVNVPSDVRTVATVAELNAALADPDIDVVKLTGDLSVTSSIQVGSSVDKTIDLNGNTMTYTGSETEYSLISAAEGSKLTIMGGELAGNGELSGTAGTVDTVAISAVGADVTVSGVTVSGFDSAVCINDDDGTGRDSEISLISCDIDADNIGVCVNGNGASSDAHTRLVVEQSTISGTRYAGISCSSSVNAYGIDIAALDSDISGYYTSIYIPARGSNAMLKDSTLSGYTGLVVKGGLVYVYNCTVNGTGAYNAAAESVGGWTDTGDGIYVEAVFDCNASVNVIGGSVNSTYAYAIELFGKDGAGAGEITVTGGTRSGGAGATHTNGKGTFTVNGVAVS